MRDCPKGTRRAKERTWVVLISRNLTLPPAQPKPEGDIVYHVSYLISQRHTPPRLRLSSYHRNFLLVQRNIDQIWLARPFVLTEDYKARSAANNGKILVDRLTLFCV